jgi:hypothetical protein
MTSTYYSDLEYMLTQPIMILRSAIGATGATPSDGVMINGNAKTKTKTKTTSSGLGTYVAPVTPVTPAVMIRTWCNYRHLITRLSRWATWQDDVKGVKDKCKDSGVSRFTMTSSGSDTKDAKDTKEVRGTKGTKDALIASIHSDVELYVYDLASLKKLLVTMRTGTGTSTSTGNGKSVGEVESEMYVWVHDRVSSALLNCMTIVAILASMHGTGTGTGTISSTNAETIAQICSDVECSRISINSTDTDSTEVSSRSSKRLRISSPICWIPAMDVYLHGSDVADDVQRYREQHVPMLTKAAFVGAHSTILCSGYGVGNALDIHRPFTMMPFEVEGTKEGTKVP